MDLSLAPLFWIAVAVGDPEECWPWKGPKAPQGYGRCPKGLPERSGLAHRAAYAYANGELPGAKWVLHRCDNPPCCNPAHLFLGDSMSNVRDMDRKGRRVSTPHLGSANGFAKLNESQVLEIRRRVAAGERIPTLAAEYGITRNNIYYIRDRKAWAHLT